VTRGPSRDVNTDSESPKNLPVFEFSSLHVLGTQINQFQPYSLFTNQPTSPHLHVITSVRVKTHHGWIMTFLMIDSGATHNFVDRNFVEMHQIETSPMPRFVKLLMADGQTSTAGLISEEASLPLGIGPHQETTQFHVTKLGGYPMVLGIPWLRRHDPWMHWSKHQITFNSPYCLSNCNVKQPCTVELLRTKPKPPTYPPLSQASLTPGNTVSPSVIPRASNNLRNPLYKANNQTPASVPSKMVEIDQFRSGPETHPLRSSDQQANPSNSTNPTSNPLLRSIHSPLEPLKPLQPLKPLKPLKTLKTLDSMDISRTSNRSRPSETTKPLNPLKPLKTLEPTNTSRTSNYVRPLEAMKPSNPSKPLKTLEPMNTLSRNSELHQIFGNYETFETFETFDNFRSYGHFENFESLWTFGIL
jgi:hypothetical protein